MHRDRFDRYDSQILERDLQRRRDMSSERLDRMQQFVEFKIAETELSDV